MTVFSGQIVDVVGRKIFPGTIVVQNGQIQDVIAQPKAPSRYILPGFIDAHVHIESSLLVPYEFARIAVTHGTVATVSDPHEIANVCGLAGVRYMVYDGLRSHFKFWFGAPSCVPATIFETAGATLGPKDVAECFDLGHLKYLSEMMNYPGVINKDSKVMAKIEEAKKRWLPIDGHAPGLRGEPLRRYIQAGITTDHESVSLGEALEKIKWGMRILIREGTVAKNFEELHSLIDNFSDLCMFCSDDKHCHELVEGHINQLVVRAIKNGHDLFKVLQMACVNPVQHYNLPVGLLQKGDPADFIIVDNLQRFSVLATYIDGRLCAEKGVTKIPHQPIGKINKFNCERVLPKEFEVKAEGKNLRLIVALDGQLITHSEVVEALIDEDGNIVSDVSRDILKLVVVNRYKQLPPSVAFIKNFGFDEGAIASSVAHDSHNIVAVGVGDGEIARAVNLVIENKGGLAAVLDNSEHVLPLPVAGLMSDQDGFKVADAYEDLELFVRRNFGSKLTSPFMTLSFMSLLVIPELKLSDKGLFDAKSFSFTPLSF